MYLERIKLHNFKSYTILEETFCQGFNCFHGLNGMGKTNLLDAIYYLCMTKSHFGLPDSAVLLKGADYMRVEGVFQRADQVDRVVAKVVPRKLKIFEHQDAPWERLSDHIGLFPVVFIAPDDTELLTEGSESRRKFLDNTLSQLDARYLKEMLLYNRVLQQRNALLKQLAERGSRDTALLDIYTQQLLLPAHYIHQTRSAFIAQFAEVFAQKYQAISQSAEQASLRYQSNLLHTPLETLLRATQEKDFQLHRTTEGIHRDDLECHIAGSPVKRFASQGQRKSYLIALKLTQYAVLRASKGFPPILLLDDLFDKLDPERTAQLLKLLRAEQVGQVFITDTQETRIAHILQEIGATYRLFHIHKSQVGAPEIGHPKRTDV